MGLEVLLPVQLAVLSLLPECDCSQNDLFLCEVVFVFVFHHSSGKETCVAPEILMEGLYFQTSMKYQLLNTSMHCVSFTSRLSTLIASTSAKPTNYRPEVLRTKQSDLYGAWTDAHSLDSTG